MRIVITGFALTTFEKEARSQGTPPPAVTVKSVLSHPVTDTGTYIGRIVPIEKVEIVAHVPGFIEQRNFTEGQLVKKGNYSSGSSRTPTRRRSTNKPQILPRQRQTKSTRTCNYNAIKR